MTKFHEDNRACDLPSALQPQAAQSRAVISGYHSASFHATKEIVSVILPSGRRTVAGKLARTLRLLVQAGEKGLSGFECGSWTLSLPAYIHILRQKHGLRIEMQRVTQSEVGWYGKYVLLSDVTIVLRATENSSEKLWAPNQIPRASQS